jgi:beta-catenin-like protein 1
MPDNPTPEMLKRMKMDVASSVPSPTVRNGDASPPAGQAKGTLRSVRVEDAPDEDDDVIVDNRNFAPGGDADYFVEEDEEGRFFGGGLTKEQKEILNIFENSGGDGGVQADVSVSTQCVRVD